MNIRISIAHALSPLTSLINNHVIKHFFIYSFGSLFLRVVSLIIIPFTMRKLTPSDYGTLSLITSFINIAAAIVGLGLRQALSIEYFHATEQQRKILINDSIAIYCAFALPFFIFAYTYQNQLITYIFLNTITPVMLTMALASIFLSFFAELLYQIMQYEQKAFTLTLIQITIALIIAASTMLFVWQYEWGIFGVICAQLIGVIIGTFIAIAAYHTNQYHAKRTPLHHIPSKTPAYLLIGFPFIPAIICSWALSGINRWMLAYYGTMHDVGIYAIADLGTQVFYALVLQPWGGSYLPYIMNLYAHNKDNLAEAENKNRKTMYLSMIGLAGLIVIGSAVCHPFLIKIFPPQYHEAIGYMWFLLLGQIFLLGSYFASALIQFKKQNYFIAVSMLIPALLSIIINRSLIPHFKIAGCTFAILISYLMYFIITLAYNQKMLAYQKS